MQLDDRHFGEEQFPRIFTDAPASVMPEQASDAAGERLVQFPLVQGPSPVRRYRPAVTLSLIAACAVVYLAEAFQDRTLLGGNIDSLIAWGANYGPRTLGGQWWRLVTHLFLHGGPFHILINMWVLWDVGQFMERLAGRTAMAMIYLLAGIAGGMASLAFHPHGVSAGGVGGHIRRHRRSVRPAAACPRRGPASPASTTPQRHYRLRDLERDLRTVGAGDRLSRPTRAGRLPGCWPA